MTKNRAGSTTDNNGRSESVYTDMSALHEYIHIYIYKLTTYPKDLPQQSVSSKKNLQVVDHLKILFLDETDCCGTT